VNRSQLLNEYAKFNGLARKQADELVTSFVEIITATVAAGEDVAISGFAKFRRIDRPARLARNPATGETVKVKAKRVARITPLKGFKDSVLTGKAPKPAMRAPVTPKPAPAAKAPAKKTAAKKTAAKKPAKKAPAKKGAAKKSGARKTTAKKR
jgi:DNA-binding protein HU-beta